MTNITKNNFKENFDNTLKSIVNFNEPVCVVTDEGNIIAINQEDYDGLIETLYLCSIPGMKEKIVNGLNVPLSECVDSSEVEW